jgi:SAM-dependent methyltransferase
MNLLHFVRSSLSFSPLRTYQYHHITHTKLKGKVLDLGGGKNASYTRLLKGKFKITSINIDARANPTIVGDVTKPFPLPKKTFDTIISLNTLEHTFAHENAFKESFRVLKKHGRFIFTTPFLHQIHGSPDDYWRYTFSAFEKLLEKHGFIPEKIIPLGTGLFCARYSLIFGALPRILRPLFAAEAYLLDTILTFLSTRYKKHCTDKYPLGYFVIARKP